MTYEWRSITGYWRNFMWFHFGGRVQNVLPMKRNGSKLTLRIPVLRSAKLTQVNFWSFSLQRRTSVKSEPNHQMNPNTFISKACVNTCFGSFIQSKWCMYILWHKLYNANWSDKETIFHKVISQNLAHQNEPKLHTLN